MNRAFAFYSATMDGLGPTLKFCERDTPWSGVWAGWMAPGTPRPLFIVGTPYEGPCTDKIGICCHDPVVQ